jgi:tRNA U38,U39,U40 pseudouridine synthase TruA
MVGTLLNVGRGHWEPDRITEILESGNRANAGPTVPARGLCLQWVRYPSELLSPVVCHGTTVGEMSNGGTECRVVNAE